MLWLMFRHITHGMIESSSFLEDRKLYFECGETLAWVAQRGCRGLFQLKALYDLNAGCDRLPRLYRARG